MTYFEWSDAIEVGHAEIDAQHQRLLQLGEAIVESLTDPNQHKPSAAPLRALIDYVQEHFAYEEGLMRSADYPGMDQHVKHHASLLKELRTYFFRVQRGDHSNPVGLISFLWNWIVLHIDSADRELVVWLTSRDRDGSSSASVR